MSVETWLALPYRVARWFRKERPWLWHPYARAWSVSQVEMPVWTLGMAPFIRWQNPELDLQELGLAFAFGSWRAELGLRDND